MVRINSVKYNNKVNYEWDTNLFKCTESYLLVKSDANRKLTHYGRGKVFTMENPAIEFFPFNDWFTVSVEKTAEGLKYYCNVCKPSTLSNDTLKFIDLDFDVIKDPDGDWTLVDEDEFVENSEKYNYPPELVKRAVEEKDKLLERIYSHTFPFDGWIEEIAVSEL